MRILKTVSLLLKINILKTLYFNLKYFPLKQALHLPFFIYKHTELYSMKGRVVINAPLKMGMVKVGPHGLGTQDTRFSRTMWEVSGIVVINGKASFGRGSKISVGGVLTLGDNFRITGDSSIICQKEITFGEDCLLSWHILIMDTDFHYILSEKGEVINAPKPISIGNHVWIGCRNTILKGVTIADSTVIAANSTITQSFIDNNCIIGNEGGKVRVLKEGIMWKP